MKNLFWFLLGITGGVVVAHFVNRDPRGHEVLAQVDARITEFTDRIGSAYRDQEARFAGPLSEVKDAAATALGNAKDAATTVVDAAKGAAASDSGNEKTVPASAGDSDIPTPADVAALTHPAGDDTPRTTD